jgi:hypothetical protein
MAKRSNLFQRIVHALYEALKPPGGTVTESAQVFEATSGVSREVDILAETCAYGTPLRIAVEVRRRAKTDNVQWIDALVGKYRDLDLDKVIAVSASGFSEAARRKADSARIQLLSATEAATHDWPAEFHRLGMAMLTRQDHVDVSIRTELRGHHDLGRESRLTTADGTDVGSLNEFIEFVADQHRARLSELLRTRFLEYYKTVSDLNRVLLTEATMRPSSALWVRTVGGNRIPLVQVTVRARSIHTVAKAPVRHTEISGHLVSSAQVKRPDGSSVELFATQRSDSPGTVTVRLSRKPEAKSKKGGGTKRKRRTTLNGAG